MRSSVHQLTCETVSTPTHPATRLQRPTPGRLAIRSIAAVCLCSGSSCWDTIPDRLPRSQLLINNSGVATGPVDWEKNRSLPVKLYWERIKVSNSALCSLAACCLPNAWFHRFERRNSPSEPLICRLAMGKSPSHFLSPEFAFSSSSSFLAASTTAL